MASGWADLREGNEGAVLPWHRYLFMSMIHGYFWIIRFIIKIKLAGETKQIQETKTQH